MIIYKFTIFDNNLESEGFKYFSSKTEAERALREHNKAYEDETDSTVEPIEFSLTKKDVLDLLNKHASHNDNG